MDFPELKLPPRPDDISSPRDRVRWYRAMARHSDEMLAAFEQKIKSVGKRLRAEKIGQEELLVILAAAGTTVGAALMAANKFATMAADEAKKQIPQQPELN